MLRILVLSSTLLLIKIAHAVIPAGPARVSVTGNCNSVRRNAIANLTETAKAQAEVLKQLHEKYPRSLAFHFAIDSSRVLLVTKPAERTNLDSACKTKWTPSSDRRSWCALAVTSARVAGNTLRLTVEGVRTPLIAYSFTKESVACLNDIKGHVELTKPIKKETSEGSTYKEWASKRGSAPPVIIRVWKGPKVDPQIGVDFSVVLEFFSPNHNNTQHKHVAASLLDQKALGRFSSKGGVKDLFEVAKPVAFILDQLPEGRLPGILKQLSSIEGGLVYKTSNFKSNLGKDLPTLDLKYIPQSFGDQWFPIVTPAQYVVLSTANPGRELKGALWMSRGWDLFTKLQGIIATTGLTQLVNYGKFS